MFNKKKTKTTKTKQKTILTKQIFPPKVYAQKTLGIKIVKNCETIDWLATLPNEVPFAEVGPHQWPTHETCRAFATTTNFSTFTFATTARWRGKVLLKMFE